MPIFSMTGYGRGQVREGSVNVDCDIRSVNNRFLDLQVRLPRTHAPLEPKIREKLGSVFSRGRIDVGVTIDAPASQSFRVAADNDLARQYLSRIRSLKKTLRLEDEVELEDVIALDGVLRVVEIDAGHAEAHWSLVEKALAKASTALLRSRKREGQALEKEIRRLLSLFKPVVANLESEIPVVQSALREKFLDRARSLATQAGVEPVRLGQEIALLISKSDVTEEIARLKSHVKELEISLRKGSPIGKQLDFILQEINREITTFGNKLQGQAVSRLVVEAKSCAEQIREQIQNLE